MCVMGSSHLLLLLFLSSSPLSSLLFSAVCLFFSRLALHYLPSPCRSPPSIASVTGYARVLSPMALSQVGRMSALPMHARAIAALSGATGLNAGKWRGAAVAPGGGIAAAGRRLGANAAPSAAIGAARTRGRPVAAGAAPASAALARAGRSHPFLQRRRFPVRAWMLMQVLPWSPPAARPRRAARRPVTWALRWAGLAHRRSASIGTRH